MAEIINYSLTLVVWVCDLSLYVLVCPLIVNKVVKLINFDITTYWGIERISYKI